MKVRCLRVILGDQLSHTITSLKGIDKDHDLVLMMEVADEATYVKHHPQKIALIFAAMRHFAEELRDQGIQVHYVKLDDPQSKNSFTKTLAQIIQRFQPETIVVTHPGEYRVLSMVQDWQQQFKLPVDLREDERFFATIDDFRQWAQKRKLLRMEDFYRLLRKKTGLLMENDQPIGDKWNFDQENRKPISAKVAIPDQPTFSRDDITKEVIDLVKTRFSKHFGDIDSFNYAVTRKQALSALHNFMQQRLARFGDYQDAMRTGEYFLFHAIISPYLNIGLLLPKEVCQKVVDAYCDKKIPINAAEGFLRQILGWREFIRGIYWLHMPDYAKSNFLSAKRRLPKFYWDANTKMNCLHQVIQQTQQTAYSHHIQRLMVTGNFALLAGIAPSEVCEWYLLVYADAFEWVELPNTHGMTLFADGGIVGSKPYAASGNYINKMSDFCKSCHYDVKQKTGDNACPFNYLYWDFLLRNEKQLKGNGRLKFPYNTLAKMSPAALEDIRACAAKFLTDLSGG